MHHDPHEHPRLPGVAKCEPDEAYFEALNRGLAGLDLPGPDPRQGRDLPLLYVTGAPRSGTTLLVQLLCRHLDVGSTNNLIARFWMRPSVGVRLSRVMLPPGGGEATYASRHGVTGSPDGPHEFGYFWRHWLRLDTARVHHLTPAELARVDAAGLRRALEGELLAAYGKGMALKNVICGFQAAFLTSLHPNSLFIHIRRDPTDTARSILHSRLERHGDYAAWWSLKPAAWPFPAGNPGAEVALQVLHCRRELEEELGRPGVRALDVDYASLCADPAAVLERVRAAVAAFVEPPALINGDVPKFTARQAPPVPPDLEAGIAAIVSSRAVFAGPA